MKQPWLRQGPCCANHLSACLVLRSAVEVDEWSCWESCRTQLITSLYGKLRRNHGVVGTPIAITRSPQRCLMMFAGKSLYCANSNCLCPVMSIEFSTNFVLLVFDVDLLSRASSSAYLGNCQRHGAALHPAHHLCLVSSAELSSYIRCT